MRKRWRQVSATLTDCEGSVDCVIKEVGVENSCLDIAYVNDEEDAEFIVRACNSYDTLLDALKSVTLFLEYLDTERPLPNAEVTNLWRECMATIAQATGHQ